MVEGGKPSFQPTIATSTWKIMLPIVYKGVTVKIGGNTPGVPKTSYDAKYRYVQRAPYNLVAPYQRRVGTAVYSANTDGTYGAVYHDAETICSAFFNSSIQARCANKAYEGLRGKLYDQVGLGVDFAEYRQGLGMIAKRCGTLLDFTRKIRRLDFVGASRVLGYSGQPAGVSRRRNWANNWLEYYFGWTPLVSDIYEAVEVVNNPLKRFSTAKSGARETDSGSETYDYGAIIRSTKWWTQYDVFQGAAVRSIDNSTTHALDQFGLLNPLSIAWELIPFSFVVDWFGNVGDVLSSLSDYSGMTLEKTYTSTVFRVAEMTSHRLEPGFTTWRTPLSYTASGVWHQRSQGLTAPVFSVNRLKLPSKERAVTALSLVLQSMR